MNDEPKERIVKSDFTFVYCSNCETKYDAVKGHLVKCPKCGQLGSFFIKEETAWKHTEKCERCIIYQSSLTIKMPKKDPNEEKESKVKPKD